MEWHDSFSLQLWIYTLDKSDLQHRLHYACELVENKIKTVCTTYLCMCAWNWGLIGVQLYRLWHDPELGHVLARILHVFQMQFQQYDIPYIISEAAQGSSARHLTISACAAVLWTSAAESCTEIEANHYTHAARRQQYWHSRQWTVTNSQARQRLILTLLTTLHASRL